MATPPYVQNQPMATPPYVQNQPHRVLCTDKNQGCCFHINNIASDTHECDVFDFFGQFGTVVDIDLDHNTRCVCIMYKKQKHAENARVQVFRNCEKGSNVFLGAKIGHGICLAKMDGTKAVAGTSARTVDIQRHEAHPIESLSIIIPNSPTNSLTSRSLSPNRIPYYHSPLLQALESTRDPPSVIGSFTDAVLIDLFLQANHLTDYDEEVVNMVVSGLFLAANTSAIS
jgi:hypothetical protein